MASRFLPLAAGVALAVSAPSEAAAQTTDTERVSVSSAGSEANGSSRTAVVSADGNVVAFVTQSDNLVPGDHNGADDVLVRDRRTGLTERISVASDGTEANLESVSPAISDDGMVIAFQSDATNLVPGDTNGFPDVFVHFRETGETRRVSVSSTGVQADLPCFTPAISGDGKVVAFMSYATTLSPDDKSLRQDIFVHDLETGATELASVGSDGVQGNNDSWLPTLNGDGRYVAFRSQATNLVPLDTNSAQDIFVHDRRTGRTSRVSVASDGTQANSTSLGVTLSADGRYACFHSFASNLSPADTDAESDVFVHDRLTGTTTIASISPEGFGADEHANNAWISADGRFVSFESAAGNLVPGDEPLSLDVFVHDRVSLHTLRVSQAPHGGQPDGPSILPSISADGASVVFESIAGNLIEGDTNNATDVYVVDL